MYCHSSVDNFSQQNDNYSLGRCDLGTDDGHDGYFLPKVSEAFCFAP